MSHSNESSKPWRWRCVVCGKFQKRWHRCCPQCMTFEAPR